MAMTESGRDQFGTPQDRVSAVLVPLARPVSIIFVFITVFTFYEVVMRYVFNAPTFWVHETTTALAAGCFAFGGAYCVAIDKHIRVVLLYDTVSPNIRRWLDVGISLIGCASCTLMSWAAWDMVSEAFWMPSGEFRMETSGSAWNPPTPAIVKAVLFVMLCTMAVQFLLQTVRHIRRDPSRESQPGAPGEEVTEDV
ncbi:C4-dicarboxylate ABC transporter permease [Rhodovibrio sodomensis]|uniref:TRAP transporter small permease protein n=1 Tax=Rhodovibrio sodomensis TaxID=1088 RepID=A0ABS1DJX9_9PROT|nr:TRAP transporter small permease [Rhodovibrio sodomensis]MBK1670222.1 C4-dicarboxylate ABC transporter permease [Rhodovibrio sodomensis]